MSRRRMWTSGSRWWSGWSGLATARSTRRHHRLRRTRLLLDGRLRPRRMGRAAAAGRRTVAVPGITHLVRPVLVVGPGVEILRDGGVTRACALHAIEPVRVGIRGI